MFTLAAFKTVAILAVAGLSGLALGGLDRPWRGPVPLDDAMVSVRLPSGETLRAGKYEVSFAAWKECWDDGGCNHLPRPGISPLPGRLPAIGVSLLDVRQYVNWLNTRTGHHYRLPTTAEWAYLARDLPKTTSAKAFTDPRLAWAADYGTMPAIDPTMKQAGSFGVTPDGVADLTGNVWEWTATCASPSFDDATCPAYRIEGAHETSLSIFIRNPAEGGCAVGAPPAHVGFRLVEDETDAQSATP
jgi:formylglycine-generating enzyme required for sulfatase activity